VAASSDRQRLGTGETTRLGPRADDGGGAPGADSPAGARTRAVLLAQSAAARGALDTLAALGADGGVRPDGPILIVGSGSSYYLALTAAFVGRAAGLRVEAAPSCEVLLYPDAYLAQRPTLAVVSRSGETSEAVAAASAARARDLATVAVTAAPTSALSLAAGRVLAVPGGQDGTLVMLRSFTGMLVLVLAWLRGQAALAPLAAVAQAEDAWAATVLAATDAALVAPPRHLVVLGGGARYGIARETVLKAEEMALVRGEAYHPLEYRHGPRAALGADDLVLLYSDPEHVAEGLPSPTSWWPSAPACGSCRPGPPPGRGVGSGCWPCRRWPRPIRTS
jgi:glucosamine--fructose-6-phosphate aminotransferase (isomerizing)